MCVALGVRSWARRSARCRLTSGCGASASTGRAGRAGSLTLSRPWRRGTIRRFASTPHPRRRRPAGCVPRVKRPPRRLTMWLLLGRMLGGHLRLVVLLVLLLVLLLLILLVVTRLVLRLVLRCVLRHVLLLLLLRRHRLAEAKLPRLLESTQVVVGGASALGRNLGHGHR